VDDTAGMAVVEAVKNLEEVMLANTSRMRYLDLLRS
jgi:hypothetical protein